MSSRSGYLFVVLLLCSLLAPVLRSQATPADAEHKGDSERGKKTYSAHCSVCHQDNRAGIPPSIPSLVGVVDRAGEKKVRTVVKTGAPDATPPMPPQPDLTDADLDDLIAYLRAQN